LAPGEELEKANPVLKAMERDVEALLVNRTRGEGALPGPHGQVLQPCRSHPDALEGFTGGQEVWEEIGQFFEELKRRPRALVEKARVSPVEMETGPRGKETADGGHKGREAGYDAGFVLAHAGYARATTRWYRGGSRHRVHR
jgi:hypothetical protein